MVLPSAHRKYTLREYLTLEEYSNVRHEYLDGQIYAMAGGTPEHGAWAANVIGLLTAGLAGKPCRVHTSDVRVRIAETGLDTYPDVSVVCGHVERDPEDENAITNPIVLVEVLSPSTEEYDRGEKRSHYERIGSLREIVFVAHEERRIEVARRSPSGGWSTSIARPGETVRLESIECDLEVDAVYRDALA